LIVAPASILCDIGACSAVQAAGGDIVRAGLQVMASGLTAGAGWLFGQLMTAIGVVSTPTIPGFGAGPGRKMETITLMAVAPVLFVATIGAVIRQDGRRLGRIWGVGLPVATLAGLAVPALTSTALTVTDELCSVMAGNGYKALGNQLQRAIDSSSAVGFPVFPQIVIAVLMMVGALMIWLELTVRAAAIEVTVLFMPLVLVAFIWPATAGMTKRGLELLAALILSKFVIVACLDVGLTGLNVRTASGVISGAAIVLMAAFTPFVLIRLVGVIEFAAVAHLEGVSRRPLQAARNVAMWPAAAAGHPLTNLVMSRVGNRQQGGGSTPVVAQNIEEAKANFPLSDA
jgi:hypothetical protein